MKTIITLNTASIKNSIAVAKNFVPKNGDFAGVATLLSNGNMLIIKASDDVQTIEMSSEIIGDTTNIEPFAINAQKLATALERVQIDQVKFEINENKLIVRHGKKRVTIETKYETPVYGKKDDDIESFTVTNDVIKALKVASHSILRDFPMVEITGIHIDGHGDSCTLVGTDSKRINIHKFPIPLNGSYTIPKDGLETIKKYCSQGDTLIFGETTVSIKNESILYTCKLLNSKYIDYNKPLPKSYKQTITLSRKLLIESYKDVSINSNEVELIFTEDSFIARDKENTSSVEYELKDSGVDINFLVDSKYALEYLTALDCENVTIGFNGNNLPITFFKDDNSYELIMPITKKNK